MKNIIYQSGVLFFMAISLAGFAYSSPSVTLLYNFGLSPSDGNGHVSELIVGPHGSLYGTTRDGGAYGYGTVFKLTPPASQGAPWTKTILHSFCSQPDCFDGSKPIGSLAMYQGAIFGTTTYGGNDCGEDGCGTIFKLSPPASAGGPWTYAVIYYFNPFPSGSGQQVDGTNPLAGLTVDSQGVLYGTTNGGGVYGYGTVFRLPPDTGHGWNMTVLNSFAPDSGDGSYPQASIALYQGALYGTTSEGGSKGYGTIFRVKPPTSPGGAWKETVLYSFSGGNDGASPIARLTIGPKGGLYGTTSYGGAKCDSTQSCGTVFKLVPPDNSIPSWTLSTLHSFPYNGSDGQWPQAGVIFGEDGALYGTTEYGGASPGGPGSDNPRCGFLYRCGTIYKLTGSQVSWTETVVYKFCAGKFCTTGAYPTAGLVAYQGAIYGTTSFQGDGYSCNCGTIFRLNY